MADANTIQKNPVLGPDEDYAGLRSAGLEYITELGSALWTDYNEHDPGITILEALCYAITELGYRTSLPMEDLLTESDGTIEADLQALFSAKKILTQSPLNINDYRKILIDIDGVSNAWLFYNSNNDQQQIGEVPIFADCENDTLTYTVPSGTTPHPVLLNGLYKVLLDLDDDPQLGDLNNSNVVAPNPATDTVSAGAVTLTITFPAWNDPLVLANPAILTIPPDTEGISLSLQTGPPPPLPEFQVPADSPALSVTPDSASISSLVPPQDITQSGNTWFVPLVISLPTLPDPTLIQFVATVTIGSQPTGQTIGISDIQDFFSDDTFNSTLILIYLTKVQKTNNIIRSAIRKLNKNRNLCEDFVSVGIISDEEIGFCCDIDVTPEADMNEVQANVYFAIDQYLNPLVNFYLLSEMLAKNYTVDEIFNGPRMKHGFIDTTELEDAALPCELYASEIIRDIMNIPGVLSVRNFKMTAYGDDGNPISGETGQSWVISLLPWHKPVLSLTNSNITFYKNQFPFSANLAQTTIILDQLLSSAERSKLTSHADDLAMPVGTYFPLESYTSVQYLFPVTYGIGNTGLPPNSTAQRNAQARQLKAYLLFYDQLLADFLSQLKYASTLVSTDNIVQTYFAQFVSNFKDSANIYNNNNGGFDSILEEVASIRESAHNNPTVPAAPLPLSWQQLYETNETFINRRNLFLDNLMARFAESFNDYVFLMYSLSYDTQEETQIDPADLITNKIQFLQSYPELSYERCRAFNYFPQNEDFSLDTTKQWNTDNVSGVEEKLCFLGGFAADAPVPPATTGTPAYYRRNLYTLGNYQVVPDPTTTPGGPFQFVYINGDDQLTSITIYTTVTDLENDLPQFMTYILAGGHYNIVSETPNWQIYIIDDNGNNLAQSGLYPTQAAAQAAVQSFTVAFDQQSQTEGLHLVEHILLRPRNNTFGLAPVSLDGCCDCCCSDDPYSFKMSVVLPYWPLHMRSMMFRDYFEGIVRSEIPAHTMVKICWIDNVSMYHFETAYQNWITALADYESGAIDISAFNTFNESLINILFNLHSEYPVATLYDCSDSVAGANQVMLGKTTLGSFKS